MPAASRSAAVMTMCTPGISRAASASIERISPWRHPAAHHDAVKLARAVQVVGIAALAAQQDRVFLA